MPTDTADLFLLEDLEDGIGHNLPQEASEAFPHAIVDVGGAK